MRSKLIRSPRAFVAAFCFTSALTLAPAGWLGWTNDLADLVRLPVTPLGHAGTAVRTWLRPEPRPWEVSPDQLEQLAAENERQAALYRRAQLRIAELEEQLEQLQQAEFYRPRVAVQYLAAGVTANDANRPAAAVELNRGSRAGVREGTVAVYNGAHLIGRVERVSLLRSQLLPLCSVASGLLRALVLPRDRPEAPLSEAAVIQLEPKGNGTFTAELSRETEISEGDLVMLADHTWPEAAQAMVIGTIESVRVKDDDLLRNRLVVRTRYRAHQLRYVTLKVELDEEGRP